jgi:hypothetical protein
LIQEVIDVAVILNALRALRIMPRGDLGQGEVGPAVGGLRSAE